MKTWSGFFSAVPQLTAAVQALAKQNQKQHEEIMSALDGLTAAVTALQASSSNLASAVNAAVVDIQTLAPSDAQLNTVAGTIGTIGASLDALTAQLTAAVAPPAPAPAAATKSVV